MTHDSLELGISFYDLCKCTVEPRNADTSGTNLKCPDYRGVLYSGVGTFYYYNEYII